MKFTVSTLINTIWVMTGIFAILCIAQSIFTF